MDNDILELIDKNDYVVTDNDLNNSKIVVLKYSEDFLKWFIKEKPINKKISFLGDSKKLRKM